MSFNWLNYLDLARTLAGSGAMDANGEAELRTAISRAYYAAFCRSRNHLRDNDHIHLSTGSDIHKEVQSKFTMSRDKRRKQIGQNLYRLRRLRNKADYDDQFSNVLSATNLALNFAEDILSALTQVW